MEAGVGESGEEFGPEGEGLGVEFAGGGEGAEGDEVVGEGGEGAGGGVVEGGHGGGVVAPEAGEAEGFFDVVVGGVGIGRIEEGVGDAVVHGGEAGAAGVAGEGDLDGGGFEGEEGEAVFGGVDAEIDEDVDLVGGDDLGRGLVGKRCRCRASGGRGI